VNGEARRFFDATQAGGRQTSCFAYSFVTVLSRVTRFSGTRWHTEQGS
jgi:hypothetical protein